MMPRLCWLVLVALFLWSPCWGIREFSDSQMRFYREKVKGMFYHAYNGYLEHAYPKDELKPLSCTGQDTWGSFSLTLVDALDTLLVMGNVSEFDRASRLVLESVRWDANVNVSVFETNIRVVGGLLTAHMMSGYIDGAELEAAWPCDGPLLRLAHRMASRLLPAFDTVTGMPFGTVNLRYGVHKDETPITCTAGVGTFLLEFGALSRLTGDSLFEKVAIRALDALWRGRSAIGLVGNHINVQSGKWTATDAGIGAGVDSYFEYLVKGGLLFRRPKLIQQFKEYKKAIDKHVRKDDWFMWVSMAKGGVSLPIFQSLEAFWPGILTMVGELGDASRIMLQYSSLIKQYGFPPEFYNIPKGEPTEGRGAFPLRPEMAESLMYLYRATSDPTWLELGAQMINAIEKSAKTPCGYATVNKVTEHNREDRMESFFLAETTKYLYLLFDPNNFIHNDAAGGRVIETPGGTCIVEAGGYIFNTEAHPLDPGAIHCCSLQKKREDEALNKFAKLINFVDILRNRRNRRSVDVTIFMKDLPEETHELAPDFNDDFFSNNVEFETEKQEDEEEKEETSQGKGQTMPEEEVDEEVEEEEEKATLPPSEGNGEPEVESSAWKREPVTVWKSVQPLVQLELGRVNESEARSLFNRQEVIKQIREMISRAQKVDEEQEEDGHENSRMSADLIAQLRDLILESQGKPSGRRVQHMTGHEIAEVLASRELAQDIQTVTAFCENCCWRVDEAAESAIYRIFISALSYHVFRHDSVRSQLAPVCWFNEEPQIEDFYTSRLPDTSDYYVADLLPAGRVEWRWGEPEWRELAERESELLSAPAPSWLERRLGLSQVVLNELERNRLLQKRKSKKRRESGRGDFLPSQELLIHMLTERSTHFSLLDVFRES